MHDYMQALHQRFCREPECERVREELEQSYHTLREQISRQDRETLLRIADLEIELREETSLASFTAGFKLAWGLSKELEADGLYSFDEEETEQVCRQIGKEE